MKENINIAELLKDCPSGMKLDCALFEDLEFDSIIANSPLPIRCRILNPDGRGYNIYHFTKYGCWNDMGYAKCVIFPKSKNTWEGFIPPCKFKDGDVVISSWGNIHLLRTENSSYCAYRWCDTKLDSTITTNITVVRHATEEEKQKLFDVIKDNNYRWNEETKTLEKLIQPKFKVGDRVVKKNGIGIPILITKIGGEFYYSNTANALDLFKIIEQDNWKLVPNKFDINTLKPFDKVLCRDSSEDIWTAGFYSHYETQELSSYHVVNGTGSDQCIPYKGNEHLLGTTNDCDEYYKTWK